MAPFWKSTPFLAVSVALVLLVSVWVYVRSTINKENDRHDAHDVVKVGESGTGSCKSCSAIDPVLEPAYNLKNIAIQSVLLEEHLADPKKRCPSCICKHFLHIIGLAHEAISLAGSRVPEYPLLEDAPAYYQALFDKWRSDKKGTDTIRVVCEGLRKRRNALTKEYVLNA
jgi:hypothetical protein